jgi:ribose transport system ATP-binding protein
MSDPSEQPTQGAGAGSPASAPSDQEDEEGTQGTRALALRARGLDKVFPGVRALCAVDFEVAEGEIHGLVGENGAGKSTLVKIITGAYEPDVGTVEVFGEQVALGDPRAHQRAGIAAIYQELTIVPEMSAAANVFLGNPRRVGPFVSTSANRRPFNELAARLGLSIESGTRAGSLPVASQQVLEIMRALAADHRLLIMDEPTASLGPQERERLYEIVRSLREQGVTVIYISHDLDEVLLLADRVSVMRDGELVATKPAQEWTKDSLVTAMLGHVLLKPPPRRRRGGVADEALRVEGLTIPGVLEGVSFALQRGEILGLAGLVGSGRTELLRALAGDDPSAEGRLFIAGREVHWPRTIRQALGLGIALAPEDRKGQGLVLSLSAAANVALTGMKEVSDGPLLSERKRLARARAILGPLGFDVGRLRESAATFSGGNQQKLVVAKWLHRRPSILLLDEFTRGIDVGAKAEMLSVIARLADEGLAVVVVSSELEEVVEVADRIAVLGKGRLIGMLHGSETSVERILRLVFEVEEAA